MMGSSLTKAMGATVETTMNLWDSIRERDRSYQLRNKLNADNIPKVDTNYDNNDDDGDDNDSHDAVEYDSDAEEREQGLEERCDSIIKC
jgi:hypothetical protein